MNLRVRKKKNKSGSVSIVIVDRTNRGYKVVQSLGSSKNGLEIEALYQKALARIDELEQNLFHISKENSKQTQIKELLSDITTQDFIPIGDELVFGKLFSQLKCDKVFDNIKNIRKNDLIFWKGHVAITMSKHGLIHAYGPEKKAILMPIKKTIDRLYKTASLKVIGIRRID